MNTFWPLTTYSSPSRTAVVERLVVSVPAPGSVTPNAWRRSSPVATWGRYCFFCSSLPWCRTAFIVYSCAWIAPEFAPL